MSNLDARLYDEYYYAHCCGMPYARTPQWLDFFGGIAEQIARKISPHTVLDVGCAMGFLVEQLRVRGIEAFGVDTSEYALDHVDSSVAAYCSCASATETFSRQYDLIVCIEVLEHLTPHDAERAIENFCQHSDDIIFSSTPSDFREPTHINVQPPEYWVEVFAQNGFFNDLDFDASFVTAWAMRFRRRTDSPARIVRDYERTLRHTRQENRDLRALTVEMRDQLATAEKLARENEAATETMRAQWTAITHSRAWRVWQFVRRVLRRK